MTANRRQVREATDGRAGYVHIPDMMPHGWSEFHRSYLAEVEKDALVVDARFNAGGHVSGLVLEKLARRRLGWDVPRRGAPISYPDEAPAGPLVLLTNEWAGSDGDIFTHGFKMLKLGPVVGTRTWGGVIGMDITLPLVDGSVKMCIRDRGSGWSRRQARKRAMGPSWPARTYASWRRIVSVPPLRARGPCLSATFPSVAPRQIGGKCSWSKTCLLYTSRCV